MKLQTNLTVVENMSAVKVVYIELSSDVGGELVDFSLDVIIDRAQD